MANLTEDERAESNRRYERQQKWGPRFYIAFWFIIPVITTLLWDWYHRIAVGLLTIWLSIWVGAWILIKLQDRARVRRQKEYMETHKQN